MHPTTIFMILISLSGAAVAASPASAPMDPAASARFAGLALKCLHDEYPNHISVTADSDADVRPPHALTPAFYGCFDWHSDVHGHWLLVRMLRLMPDASFAARARAELARSFTAANIEGEVAFLQHPGRASFERPYGLAWVLQLAAELREWNDPQAKKWSATLAPLETEAASRIKSWLPKLHYPIRIGEHDQTAFSFGLTWDWAGVTKDEQMRTLLRDAAQRFYVKDRNCLWRTNLPVRTSCRPVSPRRISCAACSTPAPLPNGYRSSSQEFPRVAAKSGCRLVS